MSHLPTLAGEIRREVEQAESSWREAVAHAIRAGELLTEAKSHVKHGEWLPWLEANFPGSTRTAQDYMRLAANAEDARRAAHLGVKAALSELAAPKEGREEKALTKPRGSRGRIPLERIPAALAAHDRAQAASDAIRAFNGPWAADGTVNTVPENATVTAWRAQLNGNGNGSSLGNHQRDRVEALITRIEYVACSYPPETHDAFDEAVGALLKVRAALLTARGVTS